MDTKMRLPAWDNVKQLSLSAWENWVKVTASLIVLVGAITAIAYPYYSSWASKRQSEKDTLNLKIQDSANKISEIQSKLTIDELHIQYLQSTVKNQEKRIDEMLLYGKVKKEE